MNDVRYGTVENHGRERVEFPFYKGDAGVRRDGDMIEFAYIGTAPNKDQKGERGMIGVDLCEIVSVVRSAVARPIAVATAWKV